MRRLLPRGTYSPSAGLTTVDLVRDSAGFTVATASTTAPGTEAPGLASRLRLPWPSGGQPQQARVYAVVKGSSALVGFTLLVRDVTAAGVTVASVAVAAGTTAVEVVSAWAPFARPAGDSTYAVFAQSTTTASSPVLYTVVLQLR